MAGAQEFLSNVACAELVFEDDFSDEQYALFELTPDMEARITGGERICFKGNGSRGMVACTVDKTFEVRRVESSNTSLVATLPSSNGSKRKRCNDSSAEKMDRKAAILKVETTVSCSYELKPTQPRLEPLWDILAKNPFGSSSTDMQTADRPTLGELTVQLQASKGEIMIRLKELMAMVVAGQWGLVVPKVLSNAFDQLMFSIDENSWPLDEVPLKKWVGLFVNDHGALESSKEIAFHLCSKVLSSPPKSCSTSATVALNPRLIAVFRAEQMLRKQPQKTWAVKGFIAEWRSVLPGNIDPDMDWLFSAGIAIIKDGNPGECGVEPRFFTRFPLQAHELASNAEHRFQQLFEIRCDWTLELIRPFIRSLVSTGCGSEADLLMKHARQYSDGETRLYCSR